jgi:hypothetical protein
VSVHVSSEVWRRLNVRSGELLLALALADISDHHGESIFKSSKTLAKMTRQGKRTVDRQLARLREVGWLKMVRRRHSGRYRAPLYAISIDWIRGANLATLPDGDFLPPRESELPSGTRRVATRGKQSVLNPSINQSSRTSVHPERARASPSGSRAVFRNSQTGPRLEPLTERVRKAKALLRAHPGQERKSLKRMFRLSDEQLAEVFTQ